MSRPVCRYWQQGNCKFGRAAGGSGSGGAGGGNTNRNNYKFHSELPYSLDKDVLRKDLTEDKPLWILSSYAPGRNAPGQLFGGYPREQSFEEVRLHYEMGRAAGNERGALQEIEALYNTAQQQNQGALNNLDGAIEYIIAAGEKHPNRIDECKNNSQAGGTTGAFSTGSQQASNPFLKPPTSAPATGAFGQTSALGQKTNPFGAVGNTSAFGQPSGLGGHPTSAFGQPSQMGGGSAFGQPSAMGQNSAFGQTSALGQKPNPFGGGGGSAFGQTSSLGQNSAFGQPSQQATSSPFGQAAQPTSGFGQPSALGQKPSPFGGASATATPSPFATAMGGSNTPAANPFAQQQATSSPSPFGQAAATAPTNPFGQAQQQQSSPFGAPAAPKEDAMDVNSAPPASTGFGAPAATPAPSNPFAQVQTSSGFGQPTSNTGFGGFGGQTNNAATSSAPASQNPYAPDASRQHPPLSSYSTRGPDGRLQTWKGKPVGYKQIEGRPQPGVQNFDGSFTRIWFPDGPPTYYKDTEPLSANMHYTVREQGAWKKFMETGRLELGNMPEMPPLREHCTWDF
ncbi:putative ccch zinc finger domain-containing protein [Phaeoacremonium minimum UCRPA7]|uniref:Putative ccch zinc finger domain-containing protein n=1 Tax=Phaeoacremonium minimum (strain UCR-PA7) TaxID=1286976 RepID=R8BGN6_PHAM7|nr:putative ccch zinc finger domain-containing protein [Phaeoacremonium minimum UCRPA7]EON98481.1 putative ccch zinc finger domain-containing protein [Phaeoacremonium minimum UCRPA7]